MLGVLASRAHRDTAWLSGCLCTLDVAIARGGCTQLTAQYYTLYADIPQSTCCHLSPKRQHSSCKVLVCQPLMLKHVWSAEPSSQRRDRTDRCELCRGVVSRNVSYFSSFDGWCPVRQKAASVRNRIPQSGPRPLAVWSSSLALKHLKPNINMRRTHCHRVPGQQVRFLLYTSSGGTACISSKHRTLRYHNAVPRSEHIHFDAH